MRHAGQAASARLPASWRRPRRANQNRIAASTSTASTASAGPAAQAVTTRGHQADAPGFQRHADGAGQAGRAVALPQRRVLVPAGERDLRRVTDLAREPKTAEAP